MTPQQPANEPSIIPCGTVCRCCVPVSNRQLCTWYDDDDDEFRGEEGSTVAVAVAAAAGAEAMEEEEEEEQEEGTSEDEEEFEDDYNFDDDEGDEGWYGSGSAYEYDALTGRKRRKRRTAEEEEPSAAAPLLTSRVDCGESGSGPSLGGASDDDDGQGEREFVGRWELGREARSAMGFGVRRIRRRNFPPCSSS
jgi:hypothetical protein